MNEKCPPREKDTKDMTLTDLTNYWTGHAVLEIGQGHSLRDAICLMLQVTMRDAYERGLVEGKKQCRDSKTMSELKMDNEIKIKVLYNPD